MKSVLKSLFCILSVSLLMSGCAITDKIKKAANTETSVDSTKTNSLRLRRLWMQYTPQDYYTGHRLEHMAPVITDKWIYQANHIDGISAYKRNRGRVKWYFPVKRGVTSGVALSRGRLYFGGGRGQFFVLNAKTGKLVWKKELKTEAVGTPTVYKGFIYFMTSDNVLHALRASDGRQKWLHSRQDPSEFSIHGASQPVISGSRIYAGFSDGFLVALNRVTGRVLWTKKLSTRGYLKDVDARAVIAGARLYVTTFSGQLYCLNKNTGQVIWQYQKGGGASVAIGRNRIYVSASQELVALNRNGKQIWSYPTESLPSQPVAFKNGIIFGEKSGSIKVLNLKGQLQASYWTGRGVGATPVFDARKKQIYAMSVDANLVALQLEKKPFSH